MKDGAYVINLDEYSDIGTHWVALWVNNNDVTYFDSFDVEHIPKEIFIDRSLSITTNIFRIQFNNVWIFLYWIYWFYASRKDLNRIYESFLHQINLRKMKI